MKIFQKLLTASALLSIASPVFADPYSDTLQITVTGTRTERTIDQLPGSVSVYDYNYLEANSFNNWRELFKYEPSINSQDFLRSDKSRAYAKGDSGSINIRGLDGNRVLTLIDGIKIDRFNYGSNTFAASRLNFIDFSTLGKLEVLKGSGSSLYGSDALGGVVSMRSIRPDDFLSEDQEQLFEIKTDYSGVNESYNPTIKFARRYDDLEIILAGSFSDFEGINRKNDDIYKDNIDGESYGYYTKIIKRLDENKELDFTYEVVSKESTNDQISGNISGSSNISSKDKSESERKRISLAYEYESNNDSFIDGLNISIYNNEMDYDHTWATRTSSSGEDQDTSLKQDTFGGSIQFTNEIEAGDTDHRITLGLEGSKFKGSRKQDVYEPNSSGKYELTEQYKRNPDTDVNKYAIYLQDEISRGKFDVIAGLRYDNINLDAKSDTHWFNSGSDYLVDKEASVGEPNDLDESKVTPNLAIMYNIKENTNIYGKYNKGFRTPSWEELNSSHINVMYAPWLARTGVPWFSYSTLGNPNLKPETSDNYEIGIKSRSSKFDFSIAGFYNKYKDFLSKSEVDGSMDVVTSVGTLSSTIYRTKNVSDAYIKGIETSSTYFFNDRSKGLSMTTSLAYTEGENENTNEPLISINPFSLVLTLDYKFPNDKLVMQLTNTYTGEPTTESDYTGYRPSSWTKTDLKVGYSFNDRLSTSLGIYNLLDNKYYMWSDVRANGAEGNDDNAHQRYAQPGRYVEAGFKFKF